MRSVLVGVRTPRAARDVASLAARLGLASVVRTAASQPEVMLRLADNPADVVLVATSLLRPDSADFTRRVLERAPGAVIVLLGPDGEHAVGAVTAGARGLVPSPDHDVVGVVAKALLLLSEPGGQPGRVGRRLPAELVTLSGPAVVPVQRDDDLSAAAEDGCVRGGCVVDPRGGASATRLDPRASGPAGAIGADATRTSAAATPPGAGNPPAPTPSTTSPSSPLRDASSGAVRLTERESQVLRAMADGKSNAEIGRELFVSEDTVKTHARRLFRKLGARDRAHAVAAGFRAGLVA